MQLMVWEGREGAPSGSAVRQAGAVLGQLAVVRAGPLDQPAQTKTV